jgi:N-succinyldiaminopimelate aminotransferase
MLAPRCWTSARPTRGFYLWLPTPVDARPTTDVAAALGLLARYNVRVLPGSLPARNAHGSNPGAGAPARWRSVGAALDECVEAAPSASACPRTIQRTTQPT